MDVQTLKELGLDKAAANLEKKLTLKNKLAIAYEHYKFVEPHVMDAFEKALKEKTYRKEVHDQFRYTETYRRPVFMALKDYAEIPPPDCLMDLKKAQEFGCFDSYEVCKVEEYSTMHDSTPTPDPIIFGCIEGCQDRFFVTQWDDDCSFEDILAMGESEI